MLAVDCKAYRNIARVTPALRGLVEEKLARDAAKGLTLSAAGDGRGHHERG